MTKPRHILGTVDSEDNIIEAYEIPAAFPFTVIDADWEHEGEFELTINNEEELERYLNDLFFDWRYIGLEELQNKQIHSLEALPQH